MRSRAVFLIVVLIGGCHLNRSSQSVVTIAKSSGETLKVRVEVARTEEERARGLMFRKRLPEGEGMLFLFPEETQAPFWMKETPISLDLIFIKGQKIVALIERTTPFSEELLTSPAPYDRVLEVPAGTASRHGIRVGDEINSF